MSNANIALSAIKQFQSGAFEPVAGCFVIGKHTQTGRAVIFVNGNFDKEIFTESANEAKSLGLGRPLAIISTGLYIYQVDAEFIKLPTEESIDELALSDLDRCIRSTKMAFTRACKKARH